MTRNERPECVLDKLMSEAETLAFVLAGRKMEHCFIAPLGTTNAPKLACSRCGFVTDILLTKEEQVQWWMMFLTNKERSPLTGFRP